MTRADASDTEGEVERTYLEMRTPGALRGEAWIAPGMRLLRREPCAIDEYRALYAVIGGPWAWRDRDAWSDEALGAHLARPNVAVWVVVEETRGSLASGPVGYFELVRHDDDGSVEIAYFGLASRLHGRRLGAALLTEAAQEAWRMGASRVWLHTCTLDAPAALPNYLARGFVVTRRERFRPDGNSTRRAPP